MNFVIIRWFGRPIRGFHDDFQYLRVVTYCFHHLIISSNNFFSFTLERWVVLSNFSQPPYKSLLVYIVSLYVNRIVHACISQIGRILGLIIISGVVSISFIQRLNYVPDSDIYFSAFRIYRNRSDIVSGIHDLVHVKVS